MIELDFIREFEPKLGNSIRWSAFMGLARELIKKSAPIMVVETGVMRECGSWYSDGKSTLLWDWMIARLGGKGYSVDNDPRAVALAQRQCGNMEIVCDDSMRFLRQFAQAEEIDLLYLDSYDFHVNSSSYLGPISALHHIGELACIYERLKPGCIIAIDDCHSSSYGKQFLVKCFFQLTGTAPIGESYITAWQKPHPKLDQ